MPENVKLFLSAVSSEFEPHRRLLADDLKRPNLDVATQEDFIVTGGTTLEKLDEYMKHCDAVIHLVGKATGSVPEEPAVAALMAKYPDIAKQLPSLSAQLAKPQPGFSYTQWEAYLALYHKRPVYVYLPDDFNSTSLTKSRGANFKYSAAEEKSQKEHHQRLCALGRDRGTFADEERLSSRVLNDVLGALNILPPTHKITNLPYPSLGKLFKGREGFLEQIETALKGKEAAAITTAKAAAVHGLGGIGKTRAAVEFAHRHADDYTALLFIRAETAEGLKTNLAALCLVLDLAEKDATDLDVQFHAALRWLQGHPGWFLILDNVDSQEAQKAVNDLLGKLSHAGHALITSRISGWRGSVESLSLDVLTEEDAAAYLLESTDSRRSKLPNDAELASKLAVTLGQLALALEQAAATIDTKRYSFTQYMEQWEKRHAWALNWHDLTRMFYPVSVAVTWKTSFDQLGTPARELLNRLAYLSPDPIPESLLSDEDSEALDDLERYSLAVRGEDAAFTVHKLVQDVTRETQPEVERRAILTAALNWINNAFTGNPYDVRSWPMLTPLMPHALACARFADTAAITDPTARLFNEVAAIYTTKAQHAEAEPLMRRALIIDEASYGTDHPDVASDLNNLASLLQATNRLSEAEPLMRRALTIDEASYGLEHPNVARDLNNLAQLLLDTNRLSEAEPLMRRALTIDEASYGPDHPNVAIRLNNLAQLLQATNRIYEAEPLMRRALAIDEASYGPDHPNAARHLNNLAQLLQATNRLSEAESLMRRALIIDEASYGPDHPDVAIRLNNLASLLLATNRLSEAEPLMRRALTIDEASFGSDHPDVARDLNNLAQLLQATNRLSEAEPLMRRALAIDEASYSPDHPKVAIRLNNLAALLQATNRLSEAEPLMARVVSIFEKSYGENHPNVATALNNLATLLQATNRLSEAEPLMRRVVEITVHFVRSTGYFHPNTERRKENYVQLLTAMGRTREQAKEALRRIAPELF